MMRISAALHYWLSTVSFFVFLFDWLLLPQELLLVGEEWKFTQSYKWLPDFIHHWRNTYLGLPWVIKIIKLLFSGLKDMQDSITSNQTAYTSL